VLSAEGGLPLVLLQAGEAASRVAALRSAPDLTLVAPTRELPSLPEIVRVLEQMLDRWGPPSGVVLTPRPGRSAPFHELTLDDWRTVLEGSFLGAVYLLRAVVPLTLAGPGARIVTVLPDDPPVGRHDRAGATANRALRSALAGTLAELAREPGGAEVLWFIVRQGRPLAPEAAALAPAAAREPSPAGLARLCEWLALEGPEVLTGTPISVSPPAT